MAGGGHVESIARAEQRGGESMKSCLPKVSCQSKNRSLLARIGSFILVAAFTHAQVRTPAELQMPQSHNPLGPYTADTVTQPVLTNSPRIDQLIRDGKLYLSLKDAIDLALENNLDLAI